ncbi:hypothetical protein HKX54_02195 [Sulfitobacter sp. M57]|uniref:hypothetical protein n=1 Tax=unclassified Sulfitobacter TaxID=196795 RepID=UPI0023E24342|nr:MULTISPECIES: hypothetical protein [unclassified Sulfitobacter]MDF3413251.1 hypothetical protein [Sulfitobacter sp. KE5]MDF3421467.1 hypothetical protein [Sulfitobacter sp. KE43]MDF3431799.1 hypothetical protein [Sulfitobacter sp. KE42]MDF3457439.1 hypothetical protein [Sulfitobacter sp. S74]MDF3461342.1 hypothetical protein [Sulfitobacter sp. Ks18]
MTPKQRDLARHALGLPNNDKQSYRNRFVTNSGCPDHKEWMQMVAKGHAWRRAGSELTGSDDLFGMTLNGARAALERRETLCPEDFPKQTT